MSEGSDFDRVAEKLEERTPLNRLEARGTLRIALKDAGFAAKSVSSSEFAVVIDRLLPGHLRDRGVEDPEGVCRSLAGCLSGDSSSQGTDSPEAVFSRLASS